MLASAESGSPTAHLKAPAEMARLFRDYPEALTRTVEIADRCRFSLSELRYQYPDEADVPGETPQQALVRAVRDSIPLRYPNGLPPDVAKQLRHELKLIEGLELRALLPDRELHRPPRAVEGHPVPGARLRRQLGGLLRAGRHLHRPGAVGPAVRALRVGRAPGAAGHRRRLRERAARGGDPVGLRALRPRAERGADADVASAERQLAAAQQELQAALQEQSALASVSDQVCMRASHSGLRIAPSCCAQHWACRLESACSKSRRPELMALMCAVPVQDVERVESAKAGAVAAVGGLLGSLPYLATAGHGVASTVVSAGQIFASCLLFGVTFRYVLAAGNDNVQLKGGVVAAFGLVCAAGQQASHISSCLNVWPALGFVRVPSIPSAWDSHIILWRYSAASLQHAADHADCAMPADDSPLLCRCGGWRTLTRCRAAPPARAARLSPPLWPGLPPWPRERAC